MFGIFGYLEELYQDFLQMFRSGGDAASYGRRHRSRPHKSDRKQKGTRAKARRRAKVKRRQK